MSIENIYEVKIGTPESLLQYKGLSEKDSLLIQKVDLDTTFDQDRNRLDAFFYSLDGRLLQSKEDLRTYRVIGVSRGPNEISDIELNPRQDVVDAGYEFGDVNVLYNFVNNLYTNSNTKPLFFVESISSDRREIRALTNQVEESSLITFTQNIKTRLEQSIFFEEFRVNFGNGLLPIAINIDSQSYRGTQAVIIRLYEPLPSEITIKDTFAIEELVGNSTLYEVVADIRSEEESSIVNLKGPNFGINLITDNNENTELLSYNDLFNYPVTNSAYELYSLANEKGARISIDHTDFNDFIYLSSAEERIKNFYYKVSLIENYNNELLKNNSFTSSLKTSVENIISNFDHYDRYLYYETGSWAWPKSTSTRPYQLFSTGSTQVLNWYQNILLSASNYDNTNLDRLINTIPSFIREDSSNEPYLVFVDMIGQHFDNIWIYSKAITDKYDADNRLDFGVSRDLVKDVVENFGLKIHRSNQSFDNLLSSFIGETYSTGSESSVKSVIVAVEGSGSLTGSVGNEHLQPVPKSQYQQELYKRIYHNLPLLLKSKGTERGIRALINVFGIPSSTLKIKTFGGEDLNTTTFYGGDVEYTSSLGKIRITNSDTVVSGSTLSFNTSVVQPGKNYSKDYNTVEIGFSPTEDVNNYIISHPSMSTFDIDDYIGDPRNAYNSTYSGIKSLEQTVFTSGSVFVEPYDIKEFVRLIKFFDNSLFKTVKELVPARVNLNTGIIIKPHILDRSKIKQVEPKWSNQSGNDFKHSNTELDYTGSEYGTNFSIDGEFEVGRVEGSSPLDSKYTASSFNEPMYNGEFSGSELLATSGELNSRNPFKRIVSGTYEGVKTEDLFNVDNSPGVQEKFKFNDYAPLSNNVPNVRKSTKLTTFDGLDFAETQDSNYASKAWSNIRYDGSVNVENIDYLFTGTKGNLPFLSLVKTEGFIFEKNTSNEVISDIINNEGRQSSTIYFYTLTRPDTGSNFVQLNVNSRILTPELFFDDNRDSGSFARTYLVEIEGSNLVKISNKKVFLRENNVIETTNINGKIERRFVDPGDITTPPIESNEYSVFFLTNGSLDADEACTYQTRLYNKVYYSGSRSTPSLFVNDVLYNTSSLDVEFNGNDRWYGYAKLGNTSPLSLVKIDSNGTVTETGTCTFDGNGGAVREITDTGGGIDF